MSVLTRERDIADELVGVARVLPRVNLLPPEIEERVRFRRVQAGLGATVALAMVAVTGLYVIAGGAASRADERVQAAGVAQAGVQRETSKLSGVTAVYTQAAAAQAMLRTAMGEEVRYSRFLNDLSLSIPDNVWVTNVVYDQPTAPAAGPAAPGTSPYPSGLGMATVTGVAYGHDDVAVWLDRLAAQQGFAVPYLTSSAESLIGTRPVVNWSTTVVLTRAALSHRYDKAGG